MKLNFLKSYVKKESGNVIFMYKVTGTATELAAYTATNDKIVTDPEHGPLFFTTRFCGQVTPLIITSNGKACPDTSAFDQAASLAKQYGGNLGQELARAAAQQLLGHTPAPQAQPQADPSFSEASDADIY